MRSLTKANLMNPLKLLSTLTLFFAILQPLAKASEDPNPQDTLESTVLAVVDILHGSSDQDIETTRQQVLDRLQTSFSFDIIIRRTLGRNWNQLNQSQQSRITTLITDLLIKAYTAELAGGSKPDIKFVKTDDLGKNKIEVHSTVSYKDTYVNVNYRLANIKSRGWQVYDILIEGTSVVSNYRGQFDEHFQTGSAEELLDLIASKVNEYDTI